MKHARTLRRLRSTEEPPADALRRRAVARCVAAALVGAAGANVATADHEGLPFTETFDDAHLADTNGTTADWGGASPGLLTLHAAEPLLNPVDPAATGEDVGTAEHTTRDLALGDLNGDGLLDLVEASIGTNGVYLNQGNGFSVRLDLTADGGNTRSIAIGDVNRDGSLDVVSGTLNGVPRLYLNSGDGVQFTGFDISPTPARTDAIELADLDGDGWLDVVVADHEFDNNWIYYNTGNQAAPFGEAGVEGIPIGDDRLMHSQDVLVGDLDNDGDTDLVILNELQDNYAFMNDGDGNFTQVQVGSEADNTQAGVLGDFDGDGFLDLVVANFEVSRVYYNTGDPAAPFSDVTVPVDLVTPITPSFAHHAAVGDINNDGWLDILIATAGLQAESPDTRYANWLYLNDGAGNFGTPIDIGADRDVTNAIVVGDIDGDGLLDIISGNEDRNDEDDALPRMNRLYRNAGTASGEEPVTQLSGRAVSLRVDDAANPIESVSLDAAFEALGPHVDAEFWVSSSGGAVWSLIEPGAGPIAIPEGIAGTDLRWRVVLDALSPVDAAALALDEVTIASDSPYFSSEPVIEAVVDAAYSYDIVAVDPNEGDTLTVTAATAPDWLELTDNGDGTATLTGTPTEAGAHDVVLEVADDAGNTGRQAFTIEVSAAGEGDNQPPAFTSTAQTSATEGSAYSYAVEVDDPEGGAVTIAAAAVPEWLTLTDNGDGTATLSGTPSADDVGEHEVVLEAADEAGATAEQAFTVTVEEESEPSDPDPEPQPQPQPPPSSGGGSGSAGLFELLGLAGIAALLRRRRNGRL